MAYFGNRMVRHVAADLERLAAAGFTGVLHTFSENDLRYYRGTMAALVERSRAAGLAVQLSPWGVGNLFGGEAESWFVAARPEAGQVLDDGRRVGVACPNQPAFRAFVGDWVAAAVATGAGRVFWDEPSFVRPDRLDLDPRRWGCRCQACRRLFTQRFGGEMPPTRTEEVVAFQDEALAAFLGEATGQVSRQGAAATLCLLPEELGGPADWQRLAATPGIDMLATTPYWGVAGRQAGPYVARLAERLVGLAAERGLTSQLWIQGFGLAPQDAAEIRAAVAAARAAGADELWTWGVDACGHMDALGTRDPQAVWEILVGALTGGAPGGG